MRNCFIVIIVLLLTFLFKTPVYAADVVINEIMYDPTQDDNYNEWIELYAINQVDLGGWAICGSQLQAGYIKHSDGQTYQNSGLLLSAGQYAVITDGGTGTEVYDNFSVSSSALNLHVTSSSICSGLANTTRTIVVTNSSGSEVDSVTYSSSWGAANNGSSLERKSTTGTSNDSSNWQESIVGGTPGSVNSSGITPTPTPTPTPTLIPTPTLTPTPTKTPTPTLTKTPTPTKVVTPTPAPTKSLMTTPKIEESPSAGEAGLVLAENIATETPTPTIVVTAGFMETNLAKILIILGGLFLASCGVVFMKWKKEISS